MLIPATSLISCCSSCVNVSSFCIYNGMINLKIIQTVLYTLWVELQSLNPHLNSMETITLLDFALKINKEADKNYQPHIYCLLKSEDQSYCSKNCQVIGRDWIQIINQSTPVQMEMIKSHNLFKIEVWDYDRREKLGETQITDSDLPVNEKQKEFSINDRKMFFKFVYDRRGKIETSRDSESSTLRISYNKSDPNLKLVKPSSAYVKKTLAEDSQIVPRYDPSAYGKWKFVPARMQPHNQKLKL